MDAVIGPPESVAFGRFRILPHRRELLADGAPVKLGGRAFDVLLALIEARGAVVGKDALMARVWPDRVVEENNLQAQISALRAVFGAERDLIRTVSGRGYQFTGAVSVSSESPEGRAGAAITAVPPPAQTATNLPAPVSELIGRDEELTDILGLAAAHRLVTLTGTGGIGKTRLAVAAARRLLPQFADGIWVAELASLADPALVPAAVAAAVGLELAAGAVSPERVANALRGKRLLLVLDNCEHVIEAAATLVEALLRAGPTAQVIATSREPLKTDGEWVYPVPPLAVPTADGEHREDPLRYGAVRLFVERSRAAEPYFAPDRPSVAMIAAICRRLDGIPLAIELAAARTAALGPKEIAARLDDRFALLIGGRRTALPRHQTLRATLDWSYELLPEAERCLLRHLAVFTGGLTLDSAVAVMQGTGHFDMAVMEGLANLVVKSLLVRDESVTAGRWRLLETVRAYALQKLKEHGEAETAARRHAEFFRDFFGSAGTGSQLEPSVEAAARFAREIDNVRAALDWSFSPTGDPAIGVILAAVCVPGWVHSAMLVECGERTGQALRHIDPDLHLVDALRMQLHLGLGLSLGLTMGPVDRAKPALMQALALAERLDDWEAQLRALWALWALHFNIGETCAAPLFVERFSGVAARADDQGLASVSERLRGYTLHHLGENRAAQECLQRALRNYAPPRGRQYALMLQLDQRVLARGMLARVLWLQGHLDQAARQARATLEEAQATDYKLSICEALRLAVCPLALMAGDLAGGEQAVALLGEIANGSNAAFWNILARSLAGKLLVMRGEFASGVALLEAEFDAAEATGWAIWHPEFLGALAEGLAGLGRLAEALAAVERALAKAGRGGERYYVPELLRIRGELLLRQEANPPVADAESCFEQAIATAREQDALFWELRAALSLARLRLRQDRPDAARQALASVYDQFAEGFETGDLKSAKALLDTLR